MTFGEKLKYVRINILPNMINEGNPVSSQMLADLLGVNQSHISKVENDPKRRLGHVAIKRLVDISKVNLLYFADDNIKSIDDVPMDNQSYDALKNDIESIAIREARVEYNVTAAETIALIKMIGTSKK